VSDIHVPSLSQFGFSIELSPDIYLSKEGRQVFTESSRVIFQAMDDFWFCQVKLLGIRFFWTTSFKVLAISTHCGGNPTVQQLSCPVSGPNQIGQLVSKSTYNLNIGFFVLAQFAGSGFFYIMSGRLNVLTRGK